MTASLTPLDPALASDAGSIVRQLEDELIEFRQERHRHPELARREFRTTEAIVDRLAEAGLEGRVLSTGTGVVCDILDAHGNPPQVAFRGDIDALPLVDAKQVPYRSQVEGVCHACGHDVHTTIALGTALTLGQLREAHALPRSVRVIFQPAEEDTPGGAIDVIRDGVLKGLRHIWALHCDPKLDVGKVGLRTGGITAGADTLEVRLEGRGGHTARPHLTSDLVYALGAVVTQLPAVLSRVIDPRAALSLVWGQVHAGHAPNAIPQSGFAQGTVRCLDADVWKQAHDAVPDLVEQIAAPYRVDVDAVMHTCVPPCVNHASSTDLARAAAELVLGPANVTETEQSLGGEDFAWMVNRVPGSLIRLGVRSPHVAFAGDLHQSTFDVDEDAILIGVRLFTRLALMAGVDVPADESRSRIQHD